MDIKPYAKNAKKHPDKQVDLIADSIERFGWQQPIVVNKDGVIIVGHGRYLAYQRYPDRLPDMWITNNEGKTIQGKQGKKLTEKEIKAYRLADNKINESEWNMELALEEIKELDELTQLTGFEDIEYLGTKGMPTDDDWASAFDKDTLPKELQGLKQVTFILTKDQIVEMMEKLKGIHEDKNQAVYEAVMNYDS